MVNTNKKIPEHCWDNDEVIPTSGWITGWQGINGEKSFVFSHPEKPDQWSSQEVSATGSYKTKQYDKEKNEIETALFTGDGRVYKGGGWSNHTDGQKDESNWSTSRTTTKGDVADYSGKTRSVFTYDKKIDVAGGGQFGGVLDTQQASPVSGTKNFFTVDGDDVREYTGDCNRAYKGDFVEACSGNKVTMVENGDYALHTQSGNWDTHVAKNGRLYTGTDLLIESGTKITLKVGGSTIEITPSRIKLTSARIDLN